jgi:hypothetical protein
MLLKPNFSPIFSPQALFQKSIDILSLLMARCVVRRVEY